VLMLTLFGGATDWKAFGCGVVGFWTWTRVSSKFVHLDGDVWDHGMNVEHGTGMEQNSIMEMPKNGSTMIFSLHATFSPHTLL